ncbi:MAG: hypothetical protein AUH26_08105 [Candidatus Rokubacteria bacterium 13_1_40CM_69_96]|nr:MAG: hypothetical protein AUH26_08105 [Candidatus Rokubacteria bacterium 13_1_40CM_69_96]
MTPEEFAQKINAWARGTMIEPTGLFHAGAIVALADEAATAAAMWETNPTGELRPDLFPLTLQLSVNLIRNTSRGTLTAEAQIVHRGRTTLVVEVSVLDEQRRLIAKLVATQLAPAAPPATAPAGRPGR